MNAASDSSAATVLVTGANRGMGLAYVRHYLAQGQSVIATIRDPARATDLLGRVGNQRERLSVSPLDQASEMAINAWGREMAARGIRFDLVINNAGISEPNNFGEWKAENFDRHWRVNVVGPALLAQAVAPGLRPGAKVVNISSGMGSLALNIGAGGPLDAYALSKAALNLLTRRLAEKLRAANITVVAINPGWVRTAMGGRDAPTEVDAAVDQVIRTIRELRPEQSGCFLSATGETIPW